MNPYKALSELFLRYGNSLPFMTICMFLFFGVHNILQEAIMQQQQHKYGVMLGYFEVLGVSLFSFIERRYIAKEYKRIAPMSAYPFLTGCLLASTNMGNMSLNYINYPTKVVFRSCKLIPTMMISTIMHRRTFSLMEYLCAMSVCLGLVFFAAADWQTSPSFHPYGLVLVSLSTVADAINPNAQEKIFSMGASRLEVTLYNNIFTLIVMTITTLASGDLVAVFRLACSSTTLSQYILLYIIVSYFAVSSYIRVIKKFGGVAAVLVATARKGLTLIMSFLIFPKPFSWYYVLGGVLAMGGMSVASSLDTGKKKSKTKIRHHSDGITNSTNASMAAFTGSENILHRQDEESGETHTHNA